MDRVKRFALLFFAFSMALYAEFIYSYVPKKLYERQVFPVTVLQTGQADASIPSFSYLSSIRNARLLFQKPLIIQNGNERFYTFYFKAGNKEVEIPSLLIEQGKHFTKLPSYRIPVYTLPKKQNFCHVLATDMRVRYSQVSHYDASHYLLTLSIEAYEANLEDMRLDRYTQYGMENFHRRYAKSTGEFFVVIPSSLKRLTFTYYNTVKERFVPIEVAVEINNATVVTQTDLNPKKDKFELLKRYTLIASSLFFFVMFLLSRDLFYLALAVVSAIVLFSVFTPRKTVCIKEGSPLYILPTVTSDIGTRIDHEMETLLLNKRGQYNKIQYKQGIIGWVKDEDLCEN